MEMKDVELSKSMSDRLYKSAFKDLPERTTYWDPMGYRVPGGVNLKKEFFEADKDLIEKFDELHLEKDYSIKGATEKVSKDLDTDGWDIPAYYLPELYVVNPQKTPMSDMIARETVSGETIKATEQVSEISPTFADEPTSYTEETNMDQYFTTLDYAIKFYGFEANITDKMSLASRTLRSSENAVENLMMKSMRFSEEKQIFQGTSDNNGSGFDGLTDIQSSYYKQIDPSSVSWKSDLRDLITESEDKGADRENLAVFTSFENFTNIANSLDDYTRYIDVGDELGFGFQALEFDGVPVMKTQGIPDNSSLSSNQPYLFSVDMGSLFMGMLRDTTITPLAKTAPVEKIAVDAYGALASEATPHIQYIEKST